LVTLQYTAQDAGFVTFGKLRTLVFLLVLMPFLMPFTEELRIGQPGKT